jgi:glutaredoxin-related protein
MNRHKVVLFMKGNPSAPKCGFSRQIVGLLRERGVEFAWYDILSDQAVREGLKKMNDWPSESSVLIMVSGSSSRDEMIGNPMETSCF